MIADMSQHQREQCLRLAAAGPGWHPYVLDKAEKLFKQDQKLHGGLIEAVNAQIGPDAVQAANAMLRWFRGRRGS